jgi:N-acyl-D-aspartate/D-glutamate deacylase
MAYDLVIRNGRIVDGAGRPSFLGDIGVEGDVITAIGRIEDCGAAQVIDADSMAVAPGFIEIHTHYDPQLCWDRTASPAAEHGVTSVIMGNCGLSLAPVRPGFGARITKMFNKIEDIDTRFFDSAVPYSWDAFGEYLDFLRSGLGVNVASVVGHSMLRHYVMGEAAQERAATDAEIAEMCSVLGDAVAAGAFGLSMSYKHLTDENNRPMASGFADIRERIALARTLVEGGRLYVQATVDSADLETKLQQFEELGQVARESGASCSALAVMQQPHIPGGYQRELAKLAEIRTTGARLFGQTMTRPLDFSFRLTGANALLYLVPLWSEIMVEPLPTRKARLSDRSLWPALHEQMQAYAPGHDLLGLFTVKLATAAENERYRGRSLAEIAQGEATTSTEAMLRIAIADDFETLFDMTGSVHGDVDAVASILDHPLIQMGGSDAGAHVAQFAGEGDTTYLLQRFVRELGKFSLERAVQRMTGDLARDFGIARRGTLQVGNFADIVVFDPQTVARGPELVMSDLPGGGQRFVRRATGVDKVIVNGAVFVDRGTYTDARAGRVI